LTVSELIRRRSVRARLIALIAGLLVAALGVTGYFVYRGTGAQVRRAIDDDLRQDAAAFSTQAVPRRAQRPATIAASVRRYLATQPAFGESARLFVVRVSGGPIVTNEPELVARDDRDQADESIQQRAREATDAGGIRAAPLGYATFNLTEAGRLRLLTRPIVRTGRTVAMLSVGETLASVQRAQQGVIKALLLAGSCTLAAAILLGAALASRIVQPLRRMARTAARVDAGDLAPRIHAQGPPDEIRVLADAFDHMLDRLEDAFAGQRAFVADASHELRTPLTVIRGQLEVLSRQAAPSAEDVRVVPSASPAPTKGRWCTRRTSSSSRSSATSSRASPPPPIGASSWQVKLEGRCARILIVSPRRCTISRATRSSTRPKAGWCACA
jgi:two-component system, OmpR family, sensor kinase